MSQNIKTPRPDFSSRLATGLFIFALPFLLFYWMVPFVSPGMLGTDYVDYHIFHRLALLFSIKTGSFPLYAPFCFYGQTSAYVQAAQMYHPITYLAMGMPGYWDGLSLEWLTLFRLLSLGLCHLFLFRLLRRLALNTAMALLISIVSIYNLNTLYHFWNVTALEAVTGTFFVCTAIGFFYMDPARRCPPLLVVLALYWLITSGYPPIAYWGLIGTVLFTLAFPFLHAACAGMPAQAKTIRAFWIKTSVCYMAGLLLSSAYLFPFFLEYMRNSSGRVDQSYAWATQLCDTFAGFINNMFYPLESGFGMFGGSPLFLALLLAPFALRLRRVKVPPVIWAVVFLVLFAFLYMQGERTPVHYWAWKYLLFLSAVRGPGRISVMLPVLFLLLAIWLARQPAPVPEVSGKGRRLSPMAVSAVFALLLTGVYACLPESLVCNSHYSSPYNIRAIPFWVKPTVLLTSSIILVLLAGHSFFANSKKWMASCLIFLSILQLTLLFRYGPPAVTPRQKMPAFDQIAAEKQKSIDFQPAYFLDEYGGTRTVVRQLQEYFMEPDLGTIYREHIDSPGLSRTYEILNSTRTPDQVVVEGYTPEAQPSVQPADCHGVTDRVTLTYSAYNRMAFTVAACRPSFFVFSYPCSGYWNARLNGEAAPIYRANGAAQAVRIPQGQSTIEFRYWSPAAFRGMAVSCITLALLGIVFGLRCIKSPAGYGAAAGGPILGACVFWLWFSSLYAGENLHTRYAWESPLPGAPLNLAFGKPTQMSSHRQGYPLLYNSRHAVDGGRSAASCFFTAMENSPWWQCDLREAQPVGSIRLYAGFSGEPFNSPPLTVSISSDGEHWKKSRVTALPGEEGIQIVFERPETLRYLNIRASGRCILTLNEVEVYPPRQDATSGPVMPRHEPAHEP